MILIRTKKPVAIVVGHQQFHKSYGHALALAIIPGVNENYAYAKDCLTINDANLKSHIYDLCKQLLVRDVNLLGAFDWEEFVWHTECLKESYKVVGDILDVNFFWERKIDAFKRTFNVKGKKEYARKVKTDLLRRLEKEQFGEEVVESDYNLREK